MTVRGLRFTHVHYLLKPSVLMDYPSRSSIQIKIVYQAAIHQEKLSYSWLARLEASHRNVALSFVNHQRIYRGHLGVCFIDSNSTIGVNQQHHFKSLYLEP